jgi:hypothetical protein
MWTKEGGEDIELDFRNGFVEAGGRWSNMFSLKIKNRKPAKGTVHAL